MKFRKLGYTDMNLSRVGLGAWAIGGGDWQYGWGPQDDAESIATIRRAIELGINWVDTAAVYGLGHSEEIVGQAVKGMVDKPYIATKCSLVWGDDRVIYNSLKKDSIRKEAEQSLRRLQVDTIDLYQIHWPNPEPDIEEGWGEIARLVQEGKIRYAGVSNFNIEQLHRIQPIHPVASLQPPYSMLRRGVEDGLLQYCFENQIGVVVYSPMQKGLLTGKITRQRVENFPDDDNRSRDRMFTEPELSTNLQLVERLRQLADGRGISVAQLAIAWVLRRPEVTAAIVGARRPDQIEETVGAGDIELTTADLDAVEELLDWRKELIAQPDAFRVICEGGCAQPPFFVPAAAARAAAPASRLLLRRALHPGLPELPRTARANKRA
jgi:aryl-alcohol dehydrogenase-like predicted oxidoreductase